MVYILSCKCQKCKKIILSYIYVELCYSENEIFDIFTYITAAVRQTAKDTEFNYFFSYSTQNSIYIYIYICICVCTHTHTHVHMCVCAYTHAYLWILLLLLLLHSRLQTPTGRARCQKPKGPSREDSPVRKEKILERKKKYNNDKTKQQQEKV